MLRARGGPGPARLLLARVEAGVFEHVPVLQHQGGRLGVSGGLGRLPQKPLM